MMVGKFENDSFLLKRSLFRGHVHFLKSIWISRRVYLCGSVLGLLSSPSAYLSKRDGRSVFFFGEIYLYAYVLNLISIHILATIICNALIVQNILIIFICLSIVPWRYGKNGGMIFAHGWYFGRLPISVINVITTLMRGGKQTKIARHVDKFHPWSRIYTSPSTDRPNWGLATDLKMRLKKSWSRWVAVLFSWREGVQANLLQWVFTVSHGSLTNLSSVPSSLPWTSLL